MKGWFWAAVLTIAGLMYGCAAVPEAPAPTPTPVTLAPPVVTPASPLPTLKIDPEQLFRHVQALNFERYREADRDRARSYLVEQLQQTGWQTELQPFQGGVNVVARRSPRPPQGAILLTAHYDTVAGSPGADDNASAVAAGLEIARLLGQQNPLRPLEIAFFDREEAGMVGSMAYTAEERNLTNLAGVVNLEMLGYACDQPGCQKYPAGLPITPPSDRGDFLGVIGDQEHLPLLRAFQFADQPGLPPVITLPIPLKGLLTPDVLRSDHAPFWARNIGAVMVGDTANFRNPHYHLPSDTPDTLDRDFLAGSAQRVLDALGSLLQTQTSLATPLTQ